MGSGSSGFLMIIAAVFIITISYGLFIIRQFGNFEKKALVAKRRQEEYIREYKANKANEDKIDEREDEMENSVSVPDAE